MQDAYDHDAGLDGTKCQIEAICLKGWPDHIQYVIQ